MITVTGTGQVEGEPDVVRVRLAATALEPTAAAALAAAEAAAAQVRAVLARHGVTGPDAATGYFQLMTEYEGPVMNGPAVLRYRCQHEIRITLRDVAAAGQVLGEVLAAGGDQVRVDAVQPGILDDAPLRARAQELAWADALASAQRLATLAARELGAVRTISEAGLDGGPRPVTRMSMPAMPFNAKVGLEFGGVEVGYQLVVTWELR